MMLIFGLMLLQTAACLELNCSFDQSDPCYTALGHKLNLMMVQDASKYDLKIHKRIYNPQDDPLCRVKYGRMRECDLYNNRPEVTVINGTVIINRVNRTDSGIYTLTLTHSGGLETSRDLQVIVEGLDRFCWFDQPDPCYAALGHKLNLPMVLDDSVYDLKLKRIRNINTQDGPDCRIKCGSKKKCDLYNNRPEVTVINGTLIINRVIRADSGNYTLALTHQEWGVDPSKHLQVIVEGTETLSSDSLQSHVLQRSHSHANKKISVKVFVPVAHSKHTTDSRGVFQKARLTYHLLNPELSAV